jgi:hypothetical protein
MKGIFIRLAAWFGKVNELTYEMYERWYAPVFATTLKSIFQVGWQSEYEQFYESSLSQICLAHIIQKIYNVRNQETKESWRVL